MAKETKPGTSRKRNSQQFKAEALALAERFGVPTAAKQLGLHESQLYSWRVKNRLNQERSAVEERLAVENAQLTEKANIHQDGEQTLLYCSLQP
jgi:transposase